MLAVANRCQNLVKGCSVAPQRWGLRRKPNSSSWPMGLDGLLAKTQYPQARLILDWWHLKKRVGETVDWLKHHGLGRKDATNWGRQLRDWLWRGKAVAALQSGRSLGQQLGLSPPVDKPQTKLGQTSLQSFYLYLRNNLDSIVD